MPKNTAAVLKRFKKILVPELNSGQLLLAAAGEVPRARGRAEQGPGQAVPGSRDRGGDREDAEVNAGRSAGVSPLFLSRRMPQPTTTHQYHGRDDHSPDSHARGLHHRPGSPLVPRLRRLLDPRPDEEGARHRSACPREKMVFVSGHRLLQPLPVLHEHLRLPHHPRPRADVRHRPAARQPGPAGLGRHRRRRRPVDRRQPPDPRPPPQRRHQDPAVQQRDLRPDEGPVLARQPARHARRRPARPARSRRRCGRCRSPSPPRRRSSPAPSTSTSSTWSPPCRRPPPTRARAFVEIYQNCKIFNDGVFEYATDKSVKADNVLYLEHGKPMVFGKDRNKGIRLNGLKPEVVDDRQGLPARRPADPRRDGRGADAGVPAEPLRARHQHGRGQAVPRAGRRAAERPQADLRGAARRAINDAVAKKGTGKIEDLFKAEDVWTVE